MLENLAERLAFKVKEKKVHQSANIYKTFVLMKNKDSTFTLFDMALT